MNVSLVPLEHGDFFQQGDVQDPNRRVVTGTRQACTASLDPAATYSSEGLTATQRNDSPSAVMVRTSRRCSTSHRRPAAACAFRFVGSTLGIPSLGTPARLRARASAVCCVPTGLRNNVRRAQRLTATSREISQNETPSPVRSKAMTLLPAAMTATNERRSCRRTGAPRASGSFLDAV